ncbi:MAG: hypothetical protein FJ360_03595 [Thaumarchaeota archaeon]|nr:hypothetical protein [Nitrososphaerota archaeon]
MLFYKDQTILADRLQTKNHIYYHHDYNDKLRAARLAGLIEEDEKRSAAWLTDRLVELSIVRNEIQ